MVLGSREGTGGRGECDGGGMTTSGSTRGHASEWLKGWRGLAVALTLTKPSALLFLEVVQGRGGERGWMLIRPVPDGISILVIIV